jgi:hypothetical protein
MDVVERTLDEARRLAALEERRGEILSGSLAPADAGQARGQAGLCATLDHHRRAAQLFERALELDPSLAESLEGVLWHAGVNAVQAGTGQGLDAPGDEAERARLRRRGLARLRATLPLERARVEAAESLDAITRSMENLLALLKGFALAGVRGEALARLPEEERREWESFRGEAERLLDLAAKTYRELIRGR